MAKMIVAGIVIGFVLMVCWPIAKELGTKISAFILDDKNKD